MLYSFTGWSCVCSIVSQGGPVCVFYSFTGLGSPVYVFYSFTGWSCVCSIVSQGGPVYVL